MPPCYQSCLVLEILPELNIEDCVTFNELIATRDFLLSPIKHLKYRVHIFHLYTNNLPQKHVSVLIISHLCLLNQLRYTYPELVGTKPKL